MAKTVKTVRRKNSKTKRNNLKKSKRRTYKRRRTYKKTKRNLRGGSSLLPKELLLDVNLGKGMISESWEIYLKNIALLLGVLSVVAIILDWYPFTMFISLPFCLIWVYCGWLRTEPQLKWVNVIFCILYLFGIVRYFSIT